MYKPNKQLREILVACVKPECLQKVTEDLVHSIMGYNLDNFTIIPDYAVTGKHINLTLSPENFDEVIECGKWYPRDRFDGNPCEYILLEMCMTDYVEASVKDERAHHLWDSTTHFMYIKKP